MRRGGCLRFRAQSTVIFGSTLLVSPTMTHPLVRLLSEKMDTDLVALQLLVASWIVDEQSAAERAALRCFGGELGAVQRRIRGRKAPPTQEEIEIALTAVLALSRRAAREISPS
jgi:hypothetical protein